MDGREHARAARAARFARSPDGRHAGEIDLRLRALDLFERAHLRRTPVDPGATSAWYTIQVMIASRCAKHANRSAADELLRRYKAARDRMGRSLDPLRTQHELLMRELSPAPRSPPRPHKSGAASARSG
jgi:hypothetical protein